MSDSPEDYELFHYGVKGMKWGVIREGLGSAASSAKGFVKNDPIGKTRQAAGSAKKTAVARRSEYRDVVPTKRSKAVNTTATVAGGLAAGKIMNTAIRNTPVGRNLAMSHPVAALGLTAASAILGGAAGSMAAKEVRMRNSNREN